MAEFDRIFAGGRLSAANENAKTDLLEWLARQADPKLAGLSVRQVAVVRVTGYEGLGGGRYWGRVAAPTKPNLYPLADDLEDDEAVGEFPKFDNAVVINPPELGTAGHGLKADPDEGMVTVGEVRGRDLRNRYIVVLPAASGLTVKFGTLTTDWSPGDVQVTLTPCLAIDDGTAKPGEDPVECYVHFPVAKPPPAFGATVDDILGYVEFDGGAGETVRMLFMPPLLPRPTAIHEVLQNASADPDAPHIVSQYPEGHA